MSRELIGVWRSLVARLVRDEEVVGSNPATPTHLKEPHIVRLLLCFPAPLAARPVRECSSPAPSRRRPPRAGVPVAACVQDFPTTPGITTGELGACGRARRPALA